MPRCQGIGYIVPLYLQVFQSSINHSYLIQINDLQLYLFDTLIVSK